MNWRERRRQDIQERAEAAAAEHNSRVADIMGFTDQTLDDGGNGRLVGWCRRPEDGSLKGQDHYCVRCTPTPPATDFKPVLKHMLAATMKCSRCGQILEGVDV